MSTVATDYMAVLRWLCWIAWADGEVQKQEEAHLTRLGEALGLGAQQMGLLRSWIEKCPPFESVGKSLPDGKDREYLLVHAKLLARADGEVRPEESAAISKLSERLGLTREEVSRVDALLEMEGDGIGEGDLAEEFLKPTSNLQSRVQRVLEKRIKEVKPKDAEKVRKELPAKLAKMESKGPIKTGFIRKMLQNLRLLYEMLFEPEFVISWQTKAKVIAAIAYFISPVDVIPDVIPVFGWLDDALVVAWTLHSISGDVARYAEFKSNKARGA